MKPALVAVTLACATRLLAGPIVFPTPMLETRPFLLWDLSATWRPSFGYESNPALAQDAFRDGSVFANLGVDLLLFRLPTGGNSFHLFFSGDDRRFLDSATVDREQVFITQADYGHDFQNGWVTGLSALHLYANEVIDLTDQNFGPGTTRAAGHTLSLKPKLRYSFNPQLWIEASGDFARQLFDDPLPDYWDHAPAVTVGWNLPRASQFTATYTHTWRPFDDARLFSPTGEVLPGTDRRLRLQRIELRWRQRWDEGKRWTTTLRGHRTQAEDNGLGYFDYDRWWAGLTVEWNRAPWRCRVTGRFSRYDFLAQNIAPDEAELRAREETGFEARLDYSLSKTFKLMFGYELERSRGNVRFDNYTAHTGQAGFEWEF